MNEKGARRDDLYTKQTALHMRAVCFSWGYQTGILPYRAGKQAEQDREGGL